LIVFGENVVKRAISSEKLSEKETATEVIEEHGITGELLAKAGDPHCERYFAERNDQGGALCFARRGACREARSFTNTKGRVQKFMQAIQPPGDARAEWEFLHELVFNVTGQNGFKSIEGCSTRWQKKFRRSMA